MSKTQSLKVKFDLKCFSCVTNTWSFKNNWSTTLWLVSHSICLCHITLYRHFGLRTKNGAPHFPAHIFKATQSIESYKNVCKLFRRKTLTSLVPSPRNFEMGKRNWRIYLTLPGHFLNIHLGHGATGHSFEIMSSEPEGQTTTSCKVKQWSILYILRFTEMRNLRRVVNPRPERCPPWPCAAAHETCLVSMHHRDVLRSQTLETLRQRTR